MSRFNVLPYGGDPEGRKGFKVLDRRTGAEVTTHDPARLRPDGALYRWSADQIADRLNDDPAQWAVWYGVQP